MSDHAGPNTALRARKPRMQAPATMAHLPERPRRLPPERPPWPELRNRSSEDWTINKGKLCVRVSHRILGEMGGWRHTCCSSPPASRRSLAHRVFNLARACPVSDLPGPGMRGRPNQGKRERSLYQAIEKVIRMSIPLLARKLRMEECETSHLLCPAQSLIDCTKFVHINDALIEARYCR